MRTAQGASDFYRDMGHSAHAAQASPHQIISLLLKQARSKIAIAIEADQKNDLVHRAQNIHRTCAIVDALRLALDTDGGGEIARNLEDLYDYVHRRLMQATAMADTPALNEADQILATLQDAWDSMATPTMDRVAAD